MKRSTVAVLGAGSWGTAVAIHLAQSGHRVLLWGHNPEAVQQMKQNRRNLRYLPEADFPASLAPEEDLNACVAQADKVIVAVPSHAFAALLANIPKPASGLSWLTKGIDPQTRKFLSQLVQEKWGEDYPTAIISGPSFAKEVARFLPTALVVAGEPSPYIESIRDLFHHGNVRVYLCHDPIGVQLSGAIKNVLAIACGISDGLNYGANARAALITRGLAEMSRLGHCMNASQETFMGLAGLGDLVLTCTDDQSRNRRFGLELGKGVTINEAEKNIGQVVEGKHNASQVCALAQTFGVELPICEEVNALIQGNITAKQAVNHLMSRPPKEE